MSSSPSRCKLVGRTPHRHTAQLLIGYRFVDCEKWRAEIALDDTVPTWEYPEKEAMFKYYPQYYHKTDKVRAFSPCFRPPFSQ
jgi:hypothetical protein